jgi:predicted dehydrogenase
MVAYMKRYDAGNELVKRTIERFCETGELGAITYVRNHGFCGDWLAGLSGTLEQTDEAKPQPEPFSAGPDWLPEQLYPKYIGYLQQYTHNVNLLRWLLDAGDRITIKSVDLDENGLSGVVVLDVNGTRATIESGHVAYNGWEEHTQIYFQKGWIKACSPPLLLKNVPASVEVYRAEPSPQVQHLLPDPPWSWSYLRELEHFVAAILEDRPFRSAADDTMTDVRFFEDVYRQFARQHQQPTGAGAAGAEPA